MNAQIVTIGTEILLGQTIDTNSAFIARKLAASGVNLFHQQSVGDNRDRIKDVLTRAKSESEIVLTTGGLGPTSDDITKELIGEVWDRELVREKKAVEHLKKYFEGADKDIAPANEKQAYFPAGSKTIPNPRGTALGMILEADDSIAVAMPGVSGEMEHMMENHVVPYLKEMLDEPMKVIRSRILRLCGIGESTLQGKVSDFLDKENPTVAPLAKRGEVHLRITAKGSPEEVEGMISATEMQLRERLGNLIYAPGETSLHERVCEMINDSGLSISVAEAGTGGSFSRFLNELPNNVEKFDRGLIVPYPKAKEELLGISPEELNAKGKTSEGIGLLMAKRLHEQTESDLSLSITNLNFSVKNDKQLYQGLAYASLVTDHGSISKELKYSGGKREIVHRMVKSTLTFLYEYLIN
ncbi:CinA family nicotinamide mononucleotide deamidase-related protein [Candidatus Bipolaricaulota bacterium]|nr:CinA family nicotinamide mononucleotide deamidase-related protein [Candidatus Bipolaricaulota bacterium]